MSTWVRKTSGPDFKLVFGFFIELVECDLPNLDCPVLIEMFDLYLDPVKVCWLLVDIVEELFLLKFES